ncbi:MAG: hypothetical protein JOY71_00760, partial [Acetobacteraceae bacterium]|nr:hypothetical protein [Acetobacteraceae bacterium]
MDQGESIVGPGGPAGGDSRPHAPGREQPAQEAAAKSRHLNIWVSADEALFSVRSWRACARPSLCLEDFEGRQCHVALDLASRTDLAAMAIVFPTKDRETGKTLYTAFARCYVNDAAVIEARKPSYPGWAAEGYLTITPGNETDFGSIETDVLERCKRFEVLSVAHDRWAATQLAQRLAA